MKKMHTRQKRKLGISHNKPLKPRGKRQRPKTFSTKDRAEAWAKERGINPYSIEPAKGKRFVVR